MTQKVISRSQSIEAVERCVTRCARRQVPVVTDGARLVEDLGYDSLQMIELAVLLEYELGISVTPAAAAAAQIRTVDDVKRLVSDLQAKNSRAEEMAQ